MSEEDLEWLITLDDPEGAPEEDTSTILTPKRQGGGMTNEKRNQEDYENEMLFAIV